MTQATFYYKVPLLKGDRESFGRVFVGDKPRSRIRNIEALINRLNEAQRKIKEHSGVQVVNCMEESFPNFLFYINSYNCLMSAARELLDTTTPIYPYSVESDKSGYKIIDTLLREDHRGYLKKQKFPVFSGRSVVIE